MKHPTDVELEMYHAGTLPFFRKLLCRLHVSGCGQCKAALREMDSDAKLIDEIRTAQQELRLPENRKQEQTLSRIFQGKSAGSSL